jgi:putative transposase
MRTPYTELYLHLVWSTWDRLPLISASLEPRIYAEIAVKTRELGCEPLSIGGIADHVHLLVRLNTTTTVATLAKEVKGASSHLVTHVLSPTDFFKWQGAYRAFTIRKSEVPVVKAYIERQKQHHQESTLDTDWEPSLWNSEDPDDKV